MAELLIYIAGAHPRDRDSLKDAGLGALTSSVDFPSPAPLVREVATGPGGVPGIVLGYCEQRETNGLTVGYFPAKQEWTRIEPDGATKGVWLGREHGRACTPRALRRHTRFRSTEVIFDDEQAWELPVTQDLPKEFHFLGGDVTERVKEAFAAHFEMGGKIYEELIALKRGGDESREGGLTVKQAWRFVVAGLAMTYCLTPEIVEYLGLLREQETLMTAAGASVEYPYMLEWNRQKKTMGSTPAASVAG